MASSGVVRKTEETPFENSLLPSISRRAFLFICDGTNVTDVTSYAFGASRWENLKGKPCGHSVSWEYLRDVVAREDI